MQHLVWHLSGVAAGATVKDMAPKRVPPKVKNEFNRTSQGLCQTIRRTRVCIPHIESDPGCSGFGKSMTITILVYLLVLVGYKVLIVAPSSGTIDKNVNRIYTSKRSP